MSAELCRTISSDYEAYGEFTRELAEFHENCQMPAHMSYMADLALEELVTNTIKYGYQEKPGNPVHLFLRFDENGLYIRVEDEAPEFDPTAVVEPDTALPLEQRDIGGLGLSLIRQNFSEFNYTRTKNTNRVELRMPLSSK